MFFVLKAKLMIELCSVEPFLSKSFGKQMDI